MVKPSVVLPALPDANGDAPNGETSVIKSNQFTRKKLKTVIHSITTELKLKGTKIPHIFLPYRSKIDDNKLEIFLLKLYPQGELVNSDAIDSIIKKTDEFTLACGLKYFWSRMPNNEILGWDVYSEFKRKEKERDYPKTAFLDIMPKCLSSPAHASIVYDFLDLLISIASHSKSNLMSGRKIAKMASLWAFNGPPVSNFENFDATLQKDNTFIDGLNSWKSSSEAVFHLFLSFLRAMLPTDNQEKLKLPRTLQSLLVSNSYPPVDKDSNRAINIPLVTVKTSNLSDNPKDLMAKVRRNLSFENKDSFVTTEDYTILKNIFKKENDAEVFNTLTHESRRILLRLCDYKAESEYDIYPGWAKLSESKSEYRSMDINDFVSVSVDNLSVQDYYIWAWLSSLGSDQCLRMKRLFGRSLIVEADVNGFQKWLVVTEKYVSPAELASGNVSYHHQRNSDISSQSYPRDQALAPPKKPANLSIPPSNLNFNSLQSPQMNSFATFESENSSRKTSVGSIPKLNGNFLKGLAFNKSNNNSLDKRRIHDDLPPPPPPEKSPIDYTLPELDFGDHRISLGIDPSKDELDDYAKYIGSFDEIAEEEIDDKMRNMNINHASSQLPPPPPPKKESQGSQREVLRHNTPNKRKPPNLDDFPDPDITPTNSMSPEYYEYSGKSPLQHTYNDEHNLNQFAPYVIQMPALPEQSHDRSGYPQQFTDAPVINGSMIHGDISHNIDESLALPANIEKRPIGAYRLPPPSKHNHKNSNGDHKNDTRSPIRPNVYQQGSRPQQTIKGAEHLQPNLNYSKGLTQQHHSQRYQDQLQNRGKHPHYQPSNSASFKEPYDEYPDPIPSKQQPPTGTEPFENYTVPEAKPNPGPVHTPPSSSGTQSQYNAAQNHVYNQPYQEKSYNQLPQGSYERLPLSNNAIPQRASNSPPKIPLSQANYYNPYDEDYSPSPELPPVPQVQPSSAQGPHYAQYPPQSQYPSSDQVYSAYEPPLAQPAPTQHQLDPQQVHGQNGLANKQQQIQRQHQQQPVPQFNGSQQIPPQQPQQPQQSQSQPQYNPNQPHPPVSHIQQPVYQQPYQAGAHSDQSQYQQYSQTYAPQDPQYPAQSQQYQQYPPQPPQQYVSPQYYQHPPQQYYGAPGMPVGYPPLGQPVQNPYLTVPPMGYPPQNDGRSQQRNRKSGSSQVSPQRQSASSAPMPPPSKSDFTIAAIPAAQKFNKNVKGNKVNMRAALTQGNFGI